MTTKQKRIILSPKRLAEFEKRVHNLLSSYCSTLGENTRAEITSRIIHDLKHVAKVPTSAVAR